MENVHDLEYVLQEFCLDWQMGYMSREELKEDFISIGWDFDVFKQAAKSRKWWVASMEDLK